MLNSLRRLFATSFLVLLLPALPFSLTVSSCTFTNIAAAMSVSEASNISADGRLSTLSPTNALKFFSTIGKLKTLKRTGWVNNEISLPESVADHMYRMSMLSFAITDKDINKDKLMKICMVHDLAEAVVGDITPYDGVSKEEKRHLEETALKKIVSDLECPSVGNEILHLWLEYEEGDSKEAALARQLDKFEMIVQANEYEIAEGKKQITCGESVQPSIPKRLNRFFESTKDSFTHPEIAAWADELRAERDARLTMEDNSSTSCSGSTTS